VLEGRAVDKVAQRRSELAAAALKTLAEHGYARTGLRDIAANSEFSHGVLHYYFRDKVDLITHCVREYKAQCVTRYDQIVAESTTADELRRAFADKLVETLVEESAMHRLWYDLRTQSMFEDELRADVLDIDHSLELMIWRIVERYAQLSERSAAFDSPSCYAMLDGVFEKALLAHLSGDETATTVLVDRVTQVLPVLLGD
jgi:AcrR family transcriptional regulator